MVIKRKCVANKHQKTRATPNDPKLSDRGARRATCAEGGEGGGPEAGSVTRGTVRCSAWLAVAFDSEAVWNRAELKANSRVNADVAKLQGIAAGDAVDIKQAVSDIEFLRFDTGQAAAVVEIRAGNIESPGADIEGRGSAVEN